MKLSRESWKSLAENLKNRLLAKFDPATLVAPNAELRSKLEVSHKGFYLVILDSSKNKVIRVGFLEDDLVNIMDTAYKVVEAAYVELQAKNVPYKKLLTSSFNFTAVWDVVFINNGIAWNENEDGIYFAWGDRYKGMYLPIEIQQMVVSKTEIMNRLCSYQSGVPSNLWRLPEGLVFRLIADSYSL
ncbi:MAG: hypothetical protein ACXAC5_00960 [Promethearchaeota archaeon]|jgi:hypothetical protein